MELKTYVVIHADTTAGVTAWVPDFPGLIVPGDRLSDTLTMVPTLLQQRGDEMLRRGESLPEPTTPDLWKIYAEYPEALVGFAEVVMGED